MIWGTYSGGKYCHEQVTSAINQMLIMAMSQLPLPTLEYFNKRVTLKIL